MLFVELQGVNHTQHFVDVTAQRQVVNHLVAYHAVSVDQERAAQRYAFVRMLDTVSFLDFTFDVSNHRVFNRADTAWSTGVLRHAL